MSMSGDFYIQPDASDKVLPDKTVLALVRRVVPDARAVTGVDESGGEARTYAVDTDIILKTQRPQQLRPRTSLEKEVFFLNHLADSAPEISVPRVLGHGREGAGLEFTVMTRMPGIAMKSLELEGHKRAAVLHQVGATLRRIHRLPQEPFITSELLPGDHAFVDVQLRFGRYFGALAQDIQLEHLTWRFELTAEQVGAKALASLPQTRDRVALHSNPYLEHIIVHPGTGTFSGLIDFGDAYMSHPACDLRRWTHPADRTAILSGYASEQPLPDGFLATLRVLRIFTDAINMAHFADRAEAAMRDLRELLAEI
jgi:Ser/Thr protein kinase RdoA (MazF antagonist)